MLFRMRLRAPAGGQVNICCLEHVVSTARSKKEIQNATNIILTNCMQHTVCLKKLKKRLSQRIHFNLKLVNHLFGTKKIIY